MNINIMKSTYTQIPSEPVQVQVESAVTLVEVVSPSDLEAGYSFMAIYDGVTFQVVVPEGGVSKGQKISVPFPGNNTTARLKAFTNNNEVPHGHWKDGIFSCFKHGIFHPTLCHGLFCPQLLTAQVMTRMHLNWKADEDTEEESKSTFKIISIIVGIYWLLHFFVGADDDNDGVSNPIFTPLINSPLLMDDDNDGVSNPISTPLINSPLLILSSQLFSFAFFIYTLVIITKTRKKLRQKYEIPETHCHGCEDLCCAFWCGNCASAQMARQTADYDAEAAFCCTNTGLTPTHHVMIV